MMHCGMFCRRAIGTAGLITPCFPAVFVGCLGVFVMLLSFRHVLELEAGECVGTLNETVGDSERSCEITGPKLGGLALGSCFGLPVTQSTTVLMKPPVCFLSMLSREVSRIGGTGLCVQLSF